MPQTPTGRHLFFFPFPTILDEWSLALIGNASGKHSPGRQEYIRGVFDKETRRKPLAFAADALSYGV
jgi:hypothetical protein